MALFFLILWIVLNGRLSFQVAVSGVMASALVYVFLWKAMGYSLKNDLRLLRNLPLAALYILNLIVEIFRSSREVICLAFSPSKSPDPVIVEFHSGLGRGWMNVLLANSITLTPGTITIFQSGDRFVIHALKGSYAEDLEDSSFIRILKRMEG